MASHCVEETHGHVELVREPNECKAGTKPAHRVMGARLQWVVKGPVGGEGD